MSQNNTITLNKKFQQLFHGVKTRYVLCTGGRGGSKSFSINTFLCNDSYLPNRRTLFTRYTLTSAQISIIPEFLEKIELLGVEDDFYVRKHDLVNTASGSEIIFRGIKNSSGNQTANLKSISGITVFVLDEAEELDDYTVFEKIDLSIRTQKSQNIIIIIMNPTDERHWVYQKFIKDTNKIEYIDGVPVPISTHPDVTHIHTTYLDNVGNLDDGFLEIVQKMKENDFERYASIIIGNWETVKTGSEFYHAFKSSIHVTNLEFVSNLPIHISFDQNVSPYITATIWQIQYTQSGIKIGCIDEFCLEHPENTTGKLCDAILGKYGSKVETIYYYGDASGNKRDTRQKLTDYDIIRQNFVKYLNPQSNRVFRSNPSVSNRGEFINEVLKGVFQVSVLIDGNCKETIIDFQNVKQDANGAKLKEKTKNKAGVSFEKYGHTSDTADYLLIKVLHQHFQKFLNTKKVAPKQIN